MKILALSDVHGDRSFIKKMAQKASEQGVDLVVLAGDIVDAKNNVEGFVGPFKEKGLEVAVLPGNHEGLAEIGFMVDKYQAINLHGNAIQVGDVGIFGCGYGDIGLHQFTEEQFYKTIMKAHEKIKDSKKKVLITHVQPSQTVISFIFPGSSGVRKAIETLHPNINICGHIHETQGLEDTIGKTRIINVGKSGKIIEI